jgi:predicted permease
MFERRRSPRRGARWFRLRRNRASVEEEIRDEIDAHIALAIDHLMARGATREQAEREAHARFGGEDTAFAMSLRRLLIHADRQERHMRRSRFLDELGQDLRTSMRVFRGSSAFFGGALVTLAVGIGANAAVFSVLQASLLQPLPYARPEQLHMAWRTFPLAIDVRERRRPDEHRGLLTSPTVLGWRRELSSSLGDVAAALTWQGNLEAQFDLNAPDRVQRLNSALVTPNFFDILGIHAERGRVFGAADEREGTPLIVLSQAFWQRTFGGDPSVVGRAITLTGARPRAPRTYVIAGVLGGDVHFTYPVETDAYVMMPWSYVQSYEPRAIAFRMVARLDPRVPIAEAYRRAAGLKAGFEGLEAVPQANRPQLSLESMSDWVRGEVRSSLQLLGAVAALLLLVTCVTVGGALLARTSARAHELAVRTALGAGRARLTRQLLTEGVVLSTSGTALGTAFAIAMQPLLRALLPESVPRVGSIAPSASLMVFAVAVAAITILVATIVPAWRGGRIDINNGLSIPDARSSADRATKRWQQGLIAVQAAIATVLLTSATLLLTSFWRLGRVPLGFDGGRVVTVEMRLLDRRYREPGAIARFQNTLMDQLRAIPEIAQVGLTSAVPFRGVDFTLNIGRPGSDSSYLTQGRYVDADYFGVLRIPLRRGRLFTASDMEGSRPVVIISESLAKRMFGRTDPIGREILFDKPHEIIGVAADVRYMGRDQEPKAALYFSRAQSPSALMCVVARTRSGVNPGAVAPAIFRAIRASDPTVPPLRFATIDDIVDATIANRRFYTVATVAFASIAFVVTAVGLVAVVARVVSERRRELAIRAALGATFTGLARHASRDTVAGILAGCVAGLVSAYAGAPMLDQFLFEISGRSGAAYGVVGVLMVGVVVAGVWLPMRTFARASLASVLKAE